MLVLINGVLMTIVGFSIYFSGRVVPPRREIRERYGSYVFMAGTAMWATGMWGLAFAA